MECSKLRIDVMFGVGLAQARPNKAEMTSVCLSDRHAGNSVVSTWIDVGLGLCTAVASGI